MTSVEPMRRGEWRWLALACAVALVLRVVGLNGQLWYDEIVTVLRFVRLSPTELLTTYTTLNNHVLYSLEANLAVSVFGEHPWVVRLPAALFGVGSVAVSYALAREAVGVREARLATLLLAVSYHHVWFSQSARGYTQLLFLTLLGTLLFVRAARSSRIAPWVGYALTIAAAGFTHLTAAMFFASHAIVYVGMRFVRARRASPTTALAASWRPVIGMGLGVAFTALLYLPIVPQMLDAFGAITSEEPLPTPVPATPTGEVQAGHAQWTNPLWTALEILRGFGALGPLLAVALPFALAFLAIGARSLFRRNATFASVYLVTIPLTLLVLVVAGMRIWPRYFFVDVAFALLCMTRGMFVALGWCVARFAWSASARNRVELGGCTLAVLASLVLLPKNYLLPKQDFEGARAFVEAERAPGDRVVVAGLARIPYDEFYRPGWASVEDAAELEALRDEPGATYLVYAFGGHMRSRHGDIMAIVDAEFSELRWFPGTVGGGEVVVMRSER